MDVFGRFGYGIHLFALRAFLALWGFWGRSFGFSALTTCFGRALLARRQLGSLASAVVSFLSSHYKSPFKSCMKLYIRVITKVELIILCCAYKISIIIITRKGAKNKYAS